MEGQAVTQQPGQGMRRRCVLTASGRVAAVCQAWRPCMWGFLGARLALKKNFRCWVGSCGVVYGLVLVELFIKVGGWRLVGSLASWRLEQHVAAVLCIL